jgi:hypothetical protein
MRVLNKIVVTPGEDQVRTLDLRAALSFNHCDAL